MTTIPGSLCDGSRRWSVRADCSSSVLRMPTMSRLPGKAIHRSTLLITVIFSPKGCCSLSAANMAWRRRTSTDLGTPNADHVSIARQGNPSLHPPYHRHILSERLLLSLGREHGLAPADIYRRSFYDSLFPTVNSRFLWRYLEKSGLLDTAVEPPRTDLVLRSPDLLFFAFFGYFLPPGDWILVSFRKN